jgi:hypothetical protein
MYQFFFSEIIVIHYVFALCCIDNNSTFFNERIMMAIMQKDENCNTSRMRVVESPERIIFLFFNNRGETNINHLNINLQKYKRLIT